jgi:preprotein translocase subunit SecE
MVTRFTQFMRETTLEMKRVSWPSMAELKESTVVVMVTVLVITVMLFAVDNILDMGMQQIIRLG